MVESIGNSGPKRGRPALAVDKARSSRIVTLVTREEIAKLRVLCEYTGESMSAICYRFIRDALKHAPTIDNRDEC